MQFLFYFVSSDVNREFVERIKKIYGVKETLTEAIVPVGHRKIADISYTKHVYKTRL